jgi:DNA-binding FadR family transcriptional regulator
MAPVYKPIRAERPSDLIVKEIWELILRGELKPGDRLPPERELVKKFNVSIVTLREALKVLEGYGHIAKKRGSRGGSVVLDITPTRGIHLIAQCLGTSDSVFEQLIEARRLVEPIIARLVAGRIDEEGVRRLQANLDQHEKDFQARGTTRCGWEFYLLLAELSGNPILKVFEEILIHLLLAIEFSLSISDLQSTPEQLPYNRLSFDGQKRVAAAIFGRDPARAEAEMVRLRADWEEQIRTLYRNTRRRSPAGAAPHPSLSPLLPPDPPHLG